MTARAVGFQPIQLPNRDNEPILIKQWIQQKNLGKVALYDVSLFRIQFN